jgi:hypothetical protein
MVRKTVVLSCVVGLAVLVCLALQPGTVSVAQEIPEYEFTVEEEYFIEINSVGDGTITDKIHYDPDWFEEYGEVFEEYPNLLSRRFRTDTSVGEVENFDVDIDFSTSTITISFVTPGLVYNFGDEWGLLWGPGYELADLDDDRAVLEGAWYVTGEFTLFEELPWSQTIIIDLPPGASGARYDEEEGAVYYQLPYEPAAASLSFLERNRTPLAVLFGVLASLSLLLFLLIITRKTKPHALPAAAAAGPPPTGPPPVTEAAGTAGAPGAGTRFCKHCGKPLHEPGDRFCRNCGSPLN